jgi:hypothetical protein
MTSGPSLYDQLMAELDLEPQHAQLLASAGIQPSVALDRGYRSIRSKAALQPLGFTLAQARVPSLLVPLFTPGDGTIGNALRTDEVRTDRDGRLIRYENRLGNRPILEANPAVHADLRNTTAALWVTDGTRRADALASAGACAVSLLNLDLWQATTREEGLAVVPAWRAIPLEGRSVFLVADSSLDDRPELQRAFARLKIFLDSCGSLTRLVYLESVVPGHVTGVDDVLGSGVALSALESTATTNLRHVLIPTQPRAEPDSPYFETSEGIFMRRRTASSTTIGRLTNFLVRIIGETEVDDGANVRRELELECRRVAQLDQLVRFSLSAEDFSRMSWVIPQLGAQAAIMAGFDIREHVRTAIQLLSGPVPKKRVIGHLGWTKSGDAWIFCHRLGAIGSDGIVPGLEVRVDESELAGYRLPPPPTGAQLQRAIRATLELLDVVHDSISCPLVGAIGAAPLNEADFTDYTVALIGPTGAFKSSLAAVIQGHSGAFPNHTSLPTGFASTGNALERLAFVAKDNILTVDDYKEVGDRPRVERLRAEADRIIRAQANRQPRSRMNPDASMQQAYPPRGLLLITGEDTPPVQSGQARTLVLEIEKVPPYAVDRTLLTRAQDHNRNGLFAETFAAFVQWLAPRIDSLKTTLRPRREYFRSLIQIPRAHPRTADIIASLACGLEMLLQFASESGAISHQERDALWARGWSGLFEAGVRQSAVLRRTDPGAIFLEVLRDAIGDGTAHLDPLHPSATLAAPSSGSRFVGWIDGSDVYLHPEEAFRFVASVTTSRGDPLSATRHEILSALLSSGNLLSHEPQRLTVRKLIGGVRVHVIHIAATALGL